MSALGLNMQFALIGLFAAAYPLLHIFNSVAFRFTEVSPHIALIYLPAFLRLFNVLVLGPRDGTLATLLGGMLLMRYFNDSSLLSLLNIVCSAAGPLIAIGLFKLYLRRPHELTSLKDLTRLTLLYAPANALLHHLVWSQLAPEQLSTPIQVLWMTLGDLFGALLGAYVMRLCIRRYRIWRMDL